MSASNQDNRNEERQPLLNENESIITVQPFDIPIPDAGLIEENELSMKEFERIRLEWVYWVDSTTVYKWWDILDLMLNLLFIASYIGLISKSLGPRGTKRAPPPPDQHYQDIDFIISVVLLIQWIPRVVLYLNIRKELRTLWSISTILSTLSNILVWSGSLKYTGTVTDGTFLEGGNVVFLFPLRFLRLYGSTTRIFTVGKKSFFAVSPVKQRVLSLALSILTTLLAVTALVHIFLYKIQKVSLY
jgi:hypothetical protein